MSDEALLSRIKDPAATEPELLRAISVLPLGAEPPSFWAELASDPALTSDHRRLTVVALFRRHVTPGLDLGELRSALGGAEWLHDEDVTVVAALAGKLPVGWSPEDTVVAVAVLPGLDGGRNWTVYLRISGRLSREEFLEAVRAGEPPGGRRVLELGLDPPWPPTA
jgi:hypothetical protein